MPGSALCQIRLGGCTNQDNALKELKRARNQEIHIHSAAFGKETTSSLVGLSGHELAVKQRTWIHRCASSFDNHATFLANCRSLSGQN